jgi:hypothetical protein
MSLTFAQIEELSARIGGGKKGGIALVLTDEDVVVDGFSDSRCGKHKSSPSSDSTYIWVGNAATQCPGSASRAAAVRAIGRTAGGTKRRRRDAWMAW